MLALAGVLMSCGVSCGAGSRDPSPPTGRRDMRAMTVHAEAPTNPLDELIADTAGASWHYEVTHEASGSLTVEAQIEGAEGSLLHVDDPAGEFVRDLRVWQDGSWTPVSGHDVPVCQQRCRLRYDFALSAAADAVGDTQVAGRHHRTLLSPPTAWLLRPSGSDASLVFRVRSPASTFVTGLWPVEGVSDTYRGDSGMFWRAPYSAFGTFNQHARSIADARVEVVVATGGPALDEDVLMAWLDNGFKAVTTYFGRFPVPRALIIVLPTEGARVSGKELGGGGASVLLWVGSHAGRAELARDWVGVHELVHLALPMMPYRFSWLAEGLATYVEPLARAQIGLVSEEVVWRDMVRGMPNGQPAAGDRGLDGTRSWGRLYWGGAMFALVADVELRKQTHGKMGLREALRATIRDGGHNGAAWSIQRFMAACDAATGTSVLSEQYARWSRTPVTVDLIGLWRDLGVVSTNARVTFDDSAPLAHIRKSITAQ